MTGTILERQDTTYLDEQLLGSSGHLQLFNADDYDQIPRDALRVWCHKNARYGLPTQELVTFVRQLIGDRRAIEIGAGHGDLAHHLSIQATDSYLQDSPEISAYYAIIGQPRVQYPPSVERLEAMEAIDKYRPDVVVASWVTQIGDETIPDSCTWGVNELLLLQKVKTYIVIGNDNVHGGKMILQLPHLTFRPTWLRSRASDPTKEVIHVWNSMWIR